MEEELAINLQQDQISYRTQVEIPITTADFYFPVEPRPLLVFVDGPVHLKTSQMLKKTKRPEHYYGRKGTEF